MQQSGQSQTATIRPSQFRIIYTLAKQHRSHSIRVTATRTGRTSLCVPQSEDGGFLAQAWLVDRGRCCCHGTPLSLDKCARSPILVDHNKSKGLRPPLRRCPSRLEVDASTDLTSMHGDYADWPPNPYRHSTKVLLPQSICTCPLVPDAVCVACNCDKICCCCEHS